MPAKNSVEVENMGVEVDSYQVVSRTEFMLEAGLFQDQIRLAAAIHNFSVARLESKITKAAFLESVPGAIVLYYFNATNLEFEVDAKEKKIGLSGTMLQEDEEVVVSINMALVGFVDDGHDSTEVVESDLAGFEQISKIEFFLKTEEKRNEYIAKGTELTNLLQNMVQMIEQIEDYEEEDGLKVEFLIDFDDMGFAFNLIQKPPMGFAGMIER